MPNQNKDLNKDKELGKTLTLAEQIFVRVNKDYANSMWPPEEVRKQCQINVVKRLRRYLESLEVTPKATDPFKITAWLGMEMHIRYRQFDINVVVDALHSLLIAEGRKIQPMLLEKISHLAKLYLSEMRNEVEYYQNKKEKLNRLKNAPRTHNQNDRQQLIEKTKKDEYINISLGPNGLYMVFKVCTSGYGVQEISSNDKRGNEL